ncbi:MAG TPA: DinB family protein [Sphingobacteriaceae bacterium]
MNPIELLIRNFEEVRRRSLKLWDAIPEECLDWRPDGDAMGALEMVRHVLEGEHLYHVIIKNGGNLGDYKSPWGSRPLVISVREELDFSKPYRSDFMDQLLSYKPEDLTTLQIIRSEKQQPPRMLGDYLNRILYHEVVHTGQMLSYLRTFRAPMPNIWD